MGAAPSASLLRSIGSGDKPPLNAPLCAHPIHGPTAIEQTAGNSERGVDMSPCSACGNKCAARLGRQIYHLTTLAEVFKVDRFVIANG